MSDYYRPFVRGALLPRAYGPIIAYDIETSSIAAGVELELRYLTMRGEGFDYETRLESYADLEQHLRLVWKRLCGGVRFVAHNGNRFDLRIVLAALADSEIWRVRCFVNKQTELRAALVIKGRKSAWFLDSRAMLGLDCTLEELCRSFGRTRARKTIDFEKVQFDPDKAAHRAYARRDSAALFSAMQAAEQTSEALFGYPLQPTIGALAIRCFAASIPTGAQIHALPEQLYPIARNVVMRGGYCLARPYRGKLWTYDQNCAYGAAMRSPLPAGRGAFVGAETDRLAIYEVELERTPRAPLPYPVRDPATYRATPTRGERVQTWLTSTEVVALRELGWNVHVLQGYCWPATFTMRDWIAELERTRLAFPARSVEALLVKQIAVNSYGKTLQESQEWEYQIARAQPNGGVPVCDDEGEIYPGIWMIPERKDTRRTYMRPQLAAFITAKVRLELYKIACENSEHFVRADTDSLSFSRPVRLPLGRTFGSWKLESRGELAVVVKNKAYWTRRKAASAGLQLPAATIREYEAWLRSGRAPKRPQRHLRAWLKHLAPAWFTA